MEIIFKTYLKVIKFNLHHQLTKRLIIEFHIQHFYIYEYICDNIAIINRFFKNEFVINCTLLHKSIIFQLQNNINFYF